MTEPTLVTSLPYGGHLMFNVQQWQSYSWRPSAMANGDPAPPRIDHEILANRTN